jgi:hypothetical protein
MVIPSLDPADLEKHIGIPRIRKESTGWRGLTSYSWDVYRHFVDGGVSIQYNDSYSSNHNAVACQETGHAFGMGHNTSTDSCMYYMNPCAGAPESNDFGEIQYELY